VVSKKNLKLDCSEFGALEINMDVDSTYNNYQSPPIVGLGLRIFGSGSDRNRSGPGFSDK